MALGAFPGEPKVLRALIEPQGTDLCLVFIEREAIEACFADQQFHVHGDLSNLLDLLQK